MLAILLLSHLSLSGAVQSGIFGGKEAEPHSRPYMASLQVGGHHKCGGVLIREDYVLTAAHCGKSGPMEVVLGAHNISNKKESSQQRIQVKQFHQHPQFRNPKQFDYDIMLLKLERKATVNPSVKVLELPKKYGKLPAGLQCAVAGWGKRVLGEEAESVLYEAKVKLDKAGNCKSIWLQYYNQDQMTCSVSDGRDGFCQGDSGGPLICIKGKTKVLYGVTAYTGEPCDNIKFPEVYMRVPFFLPWIKEVLGVNDVL